MKKEKDKKEEEAVKKSAQLPGQVVAILELCKSFEDQMDIFKEYSKSAMAGMQLYYDKIYAGECITFPKPVLADLRRKQEQPPQQAQPPVCKCCRWAPGQDQ